MADTAVESGHGTPSLKKVTFLSAAGAFLDGYDLLIINAALLVLVPTFKLSGPETGLLTSLPFLGMVIGALTAGRLCDLVGRRRVYMIDVILFLILALLLAVAQEFWQLVILRFLLGIAIGMDMPTGSSMLAEFAPRGKLGRLTAMMQTTWVFGGMVAAVMGFVIHQLAGDGSWRWMFASAAVPAVIIAVMRHSLPETPRWLNASKERRSAPRAGALDGLLTIVRTKKYRRPVAFFATYWVVESFLGGPAFIYTSLIFSKIIKLEAANALLLSATLAFIYTLANLFGQFCVLDRFGRKPLAVAMCLMAGVGAAAVGFLQHAGIALVVAYGVLIVATQVAPLPFWPWSVEQLPTRIRATGQSIGSAGGKLGQFVGLYIFTTATISSLGWTQYFVGVGIAFAALAVFVISFGRETKDTDLDALDKEGAVHS